MGDLAAGSAGSSGQSSSGINERDRFVPPREKARLYCTSRWCRVLTKGGRIAVVPLHELRLELFDLCKLAGKRARAVTASRPHLSNSRWETLFEINHPNHASK